mmetsp:Transcript_11084/g.21781  ORF Transcript_11084/g.21781 Transcript_11084/m.21781 type:complete len:209 (+) Transcript_11084:521-1147(+)
MSFFRLPLSSRTSDSCLPRGSSFWSMWRFMSVGWAFVMSSMSAWPSSCSCSSSLSNCDDSAGLNRICPKSVSNLAHRLFSSSTCFSSLWFSSSSSSSCTALTSFAFLASSRRPSHLASSCSSSCSAISARSCMSSTTLRCSFASFASTAPRLPSSETFSWLAQEFVIAQEFVVTEAPPGILPSGAPGASFFFSLASSESDGSATNNQL